MNLKLQNWQAAPVLRRSLSVTSPSPSPPLDRSRSLSVKHCKEREVSHDQRTTTRTRQGAAITRVEIPNDMEDLGYLAAHGRKLSASVVGQPQAIVD